MKVKLTNIKGSWEEVANRARTTVGKEELGKEPSAKFKRDILMAEHSPIRSLIFCFKITNLKAWVATHLVRHHVGVEKWVRTQRSDRTGIDRDERKQTDLVSMEMDANIQSLIDMAGRRLCLQSDPVTRTYMKSLVEQIEKYDKTLAWRLVPQCINYGACIEPFGNCKYFDAFAEELTKEELTDMTKRLNKYHDYRNKM